MPTLEITTKLGCSLACRFCPQNRLARSYPRDEPRELSFGAFQTILKKVPSHVRIDFSGMAEPWLNPEATAMVVHAFNRRPKVALYTTLQGMAPEDAEMLIQRYGDRIGHETPWVIHLPDDEGNMTGWRMSDDYAHALSRFTLDGASLPFGELRDERRFLAAETAPAVGAEEAVEDLVA